MMEHETFFYQLYLNRQPVLACPSATVRHNVTHDQTYDATSFRKGEKNREQLQFWCKDFPEVRTLTTPYWTWRCAARRACQPRWASAFPFDGSFCEEMLWDAADDSSRVLRPLVAPYHDAGRFPYVGGGGRRRGRAPRAAARPRALAAVAHRAARVAAAHVAELPVARRPGRRTAAVDYDLVPWRHAYVYPHRRRGNASGSLLMGDAVSVDVARGRLASAAEEEPLALAAVRCRRWRTSPSSGERVDDDAMVHIGRMWRWLGGRAPRLAPLPPRRCGGARRRGRAALRRPQRGAPAAARRVARVDALGGSRGRPRELAAQASLKAAAGATSRRGGGCGGLARPSRRRRPAFWAQRVSAKGRPRERCASQPHDAGGRSCSRRPSSTRGVQVVAREEGPAARRPGGATHSAPGGRRTSGRLGGAAAAAGEGKAVAGGRSR